MIDPATLSIIIIGIFLIDHLLIIATNPATLTESPSTQSSAEIVEQSRGRSIAVFAIVLVVIQFTLSGDSLTYYDILTLTVLIIATGFLIITFTLELFADLKILFFRIQITSLRYAGLLLFLGLYFLLRSKDVPEVLPNAYGFFLGVSWISWITHELHYIFRTQKREWDNIDMSKKDWVRLLFE